MKKRNRILITTFFIFLSLGLGIFLALSSWNGKIFFHSRFKTRQPSSLEGEGAKENLQIHSYTINKSSEEDLINHTKLDMDSGGIHLSIGHFLIKDENGAQELACNIYKKMEILLYSGDMAVSGSPVIMKILSLCKVSKENPDQIESLYIPLEEIYSNPPSEGEFKPVQKTSIPPTHSVGSQNLVQNEENLQRQTDSKEQNEIQKINENTVLEKTEDENLRSSFQIFFENVGFTWPSVWYVHSIRFYEFKFAEDMLENLESNEGNQREAHQKVKEVLNQRGENQQDERSREPSSKRDPKKAFFPSEFKMNSRTIQKIRKNPLIIQWKKKK